MSVLNVAFEAVQGLDDDQRDRPLALARLWQRNQPRTSQRRAMQDLGKLVTIICGGNRSGKTEGSAMFAVAVALGRDHPDVVEWLDANGLDPVATVPNRGPGRVWAVALDSGDSTEYVRPKISKFLPAGCKWRNQYGNGPAEVNLPNGGHIGFKSVDQGRDGFQGTAKHLIWFDEEPSDEGVVEECLMRLLDYRGRIFMSLTPLNGLTWLYDLWVEQPPPEVKVHWLHGEDNPYIPPDMLELLLKQFGPHVRAARARGEWVVLEGRVFEFYRHLHVVPERKIPHSWRRFGSIDFGTRNPFAFIRFALDPTDDTLHIVAEHYQAEWTLSRHADRINEMNEADSRELEWVVADSADYGSRLTLSTEHGIPTLAAPKEVREGLNAVAERLEPDAEGKVHLVVHDCCPNTIREFEGYIWDPVNSTKRDQPDAPLKKNDHAMDAVRYLCLALRRMGG